jgi:hypothetical protein
VNQPETISDPPRRSRRIALCEEAEANQADALEPPIQAPDVEQDAEQEPAPLIVQEEEEQLPEINDPRQEPGINLDDANIMEGQPAAVNPEEQAAAAGVAAVAFALTPASAHSNILDYTRREHMRVYELAVMPLAGDKFDGTTENLTNFLTRLREKAENFTWLSTVCRVQVSPGPPPVVRNK